MPGACRRARSSGACSARPASVLGITLYMQPVQDLTIDSTVSRTQYQFVLQSAKPEDFDTWVPRLHGAAAEGARDRRRHQRPAGQGPVALHQDRPRCRRALRHHRRIGRQRALRRFRPAHRVDRLHPVEPVSRDLRGRAVDGPLRRVAVQPLPARLGRQAGAAVGHRHLRGALRAAPQSTGWASSPPPPSPSTWRRAPRSARRSTPSRRRSARSACRASITTALPGRRASPSRSRSTASSC